MNLHVVDCEDFAEILALSVVLDQWDRPDGSRVYVAEYAENDVLFVSEAGTGSVLVIESGVEPYGTSIHDEARHAVKLGLL